MNYIDWIVLFGTLISIVAYGVYKTRGSQTIQGYLKGDNSMKWWMIGVSIMATQASAITFLSTPGQAIEDGMRFIQFYFGLPLAMVIISVTMVPIYYRLKVYTAYEYLESRFDLKTRTLAAILFLILRGLSAGITLYAPAIVLSTILGWNIFATTSLIGLFVIIYTVSGGTKAVSITQRQQMTIIMSGMFLAGFVAYSMLPESLSFGETLNLAGELGKFNIVNVLPSDIEQNLPAGVATVDELSLFQKVNLILSDRYNIWTGLIASTFLFLSYFGTDQSQVSRYLGGKSIRESRMGLIFNGLLKIPMQFVILFIGVLVYVFFLFNQPPVFHNTALYQTAMQTSSQQELMALEQEYKSVLNKKEVATQRLVAAIENDDAAVKQNARAEVLAFQQDEKVIRDKVKASIAKAVPGSKTQDRDYIFLNFVLTYLPHGIIGLLLAVMFSAAMSSMASELNALASTTTVDIYKRSFHADATDKHYVKASRSFTLMWALLAMVFAMLAGFAENLIQFVNIVGSLFYGTILGIFLCAFYVKRVQGTAVFWAALLAEVVVLYCYLFTDLAFLLYNIIGCVLVVVVSLVIQGFVKKEGTH
ncbi:MAG: sodium:solute symporter [Cytophagia bacterium]|nr:sodium:solute symporter [Cytophagia bacterium]NBW35270.1 sodium:solute symporter [Cytophagia bacterium]